jgi:hypothetical protein
MKPYLVSDKWRPDWSPDYVYSLLFDAHACPFKIGRTTNLPQRFHAHKRWGGEFITLRLWPAVDIVQLEQEALAIARRYATGAIGPEMFAVPDPKKVLRELDRWATAAGLHNVGPKLKWR